MVWRVFRVKNKCVVTTQTELPNKWFLHDDCRFVTCFDVLSCDGILSSCHDFQIHTSYSSWFENGLRACIITLIWNLFACFLWNQIKQFLKYDFLNSPALLLKPLFCMLTCEGLLNDQFRKYVFFLNHHYFWNLFCIFTWELRSSRIILWWKHMKQFLRYNFFRIVITFESCLHAYLQNM